MGSVWRRYRVLSEKSNRQKKFVDCAVRTVCMDANMACPYVRHMAGPYRGHVEAPRSDTWQEDLVDLGASWANPEVTRVTTRRVTRGTGDISG
jgi:hypothetical protein